MASDVGALSATTSLETATSSKSFPIEKMAGTMGGACPVDEGHNITRSSVDARWQSAPAVRSGRVEGSAPPCGQLSATSPMHSRPGTECGLYHNGRQRRHGFCSSSAATSQQSSEIAMMRKGEALLGCRRPCNLRCRASMRAGRNSPLLGIGLALLRTAPSVC